jgi:excisionase family DNA binding protein
MNDHNERTGQVADGCLAVEEATEFSGIGRSELYLRMERGELPFVKIGRRRLIPPRALVKLLEENLVQRQAN